MFSSRVDGGGGCLPCTYHDCNKTYFDEFLATCFLNLDVECVSYCCEEAGVDGQSNPILVNVAACLHCGTEEQPAACMSSTAGERKPCVEMQSGCCQCSSPLTHIMTCVLVKCSSTRCFRFIIILLLCWRLYNSHSFEVISFAFAMKRTFIFIEKNLIYTLHWLLYENKNNLTIATVKPL